ncbi:hypothetical protein BJ944DRAFT_269623 [Cunninghamella echinulata]|nr:hypothetical protein BJ944DRAFT_269623 [Cunninghamella echinulata]
MDQSTTTITHYYSTKSKLYLLTTMTFNCINANKLCYFCGSTKHNSSDCPMYA